MMVKYIIKRLLWMIPVILGVLIIVFILSEITPGDPVDHIVGTDEKSNARWLGTGPLIVRDNPANGSPVVPEIIPADTYIRNPATGLYHKLTAAVNEYGEIVLDCDPEGIER